MELTIVAESPAQYLGILATPILLKLFVFQHSGFKSWLPLNSFV